MVPTPFAETAATTYRALPAMIALRRSGLPSLPTTARFWRAVGPAARGPWNLARPRYRGALAESAVCLPAGCPLGAPGRPRPAGRLRAGRLGQADLHRPAAVEHLLVRRR